MITIKNRISDVTILNDPSSFLPLSLPILVNPSLSFLVKTILNEPITILKLTALILKETRSPLKMLADFPKLSKNWMLVFLNIF